MKPARQLVEQFSRDNLDVPLTETEMAQLTAAIEARDREVVEACAKAACDCNDRCDAGRRIRSLAPPPGGTTLSPTT